MSAVRSDVLQVIMSTAPVICYKDGLLPQGKELTQGDIWVREGKIVDPHHLFFREHRSPDTVIDCSNHIVAPGFIDIQINGGFGVDFSSLEQGDVAQGVETVAKGLLACGVTSFCPTIVTSTAEYYDAVLPEFVCSPGGRHGAAVLGVHLEGPFISLRKKGAHPEPLILSHLSPSAVQQTYGGCLDNVRIVTLAPELPGAEETIQWLTRKKRVVVSLGHSMATLDIAEQGVRSGASLITHLFNAMLPFHHRDPGIVGLLTSQSVGGAPVYYSLIADGNHTHETVQRIAYKANRRGAVLVTDAMSAMGLTGRRFSLGQGTVEVVGGAARLAGTNTLAGSVATMDQCVRHFMRATGCSRSEAVLAASRHPAEVLQLQSSRGSLECGALADLVILDQELNVQATCIAGEPVWTLPGSAMHRACSQYH